MKTKVCARCKDPKLVEEFRKRKDRGTRSPYCNECQRLYGREHYVSNKQYYLDKAKRNDAKYKEQIYMWLFGYFKEHPCLDCGETDPVILEFDHRDGEKKETEVGTLLHACNFSKVKREVAKCDVRCGNCHKKRTAIQRNWYWIEFLKKFDSVAQLDRASGYEPEG